MSGGGAVPNPSPRLPLVWGLDPGSALSDVTENEREGEGRVDGGRRATHCRTRPTSCRTGHVRMGGEERTRIFGEGPKPSRRDVRAELDSAMARASGLAPSDRTCPSLPMYVRAYPALPDSGAERRESPVGLSVQRQSVGSSWCMEASCCWRGSSASSRSFSGALRSLGGSGAAPSAVQCAGSVTLVALNADASTNTLWVWTCPALARLLH